MPRREKSVSDIAAQVSRISNYIKNRRGASRGGRLTNAAKNRIYRVRSIANRYIDNIQRATGMTADQADDNIRKGIRLEKGRRGMTDAPAVLNPGVPDPSVQRDVYMNTPRQVVRPGNPGRYTADRMIRQGQRPQGGGGGGSRGNSTP